MRVHEALREAVCLLKQHPVSEPSLDAELLLASVLQRGRAFLLAHFQDDLEAGLQSSFFAAIDQRCRGMPIQYILGRQEFRGLEFEVTPDVLIPRPETELLVERALSCLGPTQNPTVVDIGTGSGCIAISIAVERPGARIFATDVSEPALEVAKRNAQKHRVEHRLQFLTGDLLSPLEPLLQPGSVDCVCSNPPYVADHELTSLQREVRDWEPRLALTAGGEGTDLIEKLIPQSWSYLRSGGYLVLEIGFNMQERVQALFKEGWQSIEVGGDLNGIPRVVVARKAMAGCRR